MNQFFFIAIYSILSHQVYGKFCEISADKVCTFENVSLKENETLPYNKNYGSKEVRKVKFEPSNASDLFEIPSELFNYFEIMEIFDLKNQNIRKIGQKAFCEAKNLKKLHLDLNRIERIKRDSFIGATNLENLWIRKNSISNIQEGAFNDLQNLKTLSLSENRLEKVPPKLLEPLENLEQIWLFANQISFLHKDLFEKNLKLREIHLHENQLISTDTKIFSNLKNLVLLTLQRNKCVNQLWYPNACQRIQNIDLKFENFERKMEKMFNEKILDLKENLAVVNISDMFRALTKVVAETSKKAKESDNTWDDKIEESEDGYPIQKLARNTL